MATTTSNWNIPSPTDPDEWDITSDLGTMATAIDSAITLAGTLRVKTLAALQALDTSKLQYLQQAIVYADSDATKDGNYVWTGSKWADANIWAEGTIRQEAAGEGKYPGGNHDIQMSITSQATDAGFTNTDSWHVGVPLSGTYIISGEANCNFNTNTGVGYQYRRGGTWYPIWPRGYFDYGEFSPNPRWATRTLPTVMRNFIAGDCVNFYFEQQMWVGSMCHLVVARIGN